MLTDTFIHSLRACGGEISTADDCTLAESLAVLLHDEGLVVVTPELESLAAQLAEQGFNCRVATRAGVGNEGLEADLRKAGAAVTRGLVGVARSGTVAVGPGGGNGGLLSALPPRHVVLLREEDIVDSLAQAVEVVCEHFPELGGEAVFISGPSRTADIEMMSVIGVHGPLELHVIVVERKAS